MNHQIIRVEKGIANRFPNKVIEVNEKLLREEYLPLYNEILLHEQSHTDKGWTWKDVSLDLKGFKEKKLWWKFILTTPNSWWQFIPLYKSSYGKWFIDITLILFYGFFALILGILGLLTWNW